ncbi:MAG: hypothetical protein GYA24_05175, partial [Candidatus Lokiarchaeota archaeon]|nr:hypothetical protein [Candidatus Lokiarchaeota archaeon]
RVHVVESGFNVQVVKLGLIDDDTKYEIVAGVDVAGSTILLAFTWLVANGVTSWDAATVARYDEIVAMTCADVAPGLPGIGEDITIGTSKGVMSYKLGQPITESIIELPNPAQYTSASTSIVAGRAGLSTTSIDPFSTVRGMDEMAIDGSTPIDRDGSTVVINEIGFFRESVGGWMDGEDLHLYSESYLRHSFVELYNYGTEPVYIGGMTLYTNPVFDGAGAVTYHQGKYVIPHAVQGWRGHPAFDGYIYPKNYLVILHNLAGRWDSQGHVYFDGDVPLSVPVLIADQPTSIVASWQYDGTPIYEPVTLMDWWGYSPPFKYLDQHGYQQGGVFWTGIEDFRLWFDLDQFRCGTWLDDAGIIENYVGDRARLVPESDTWYNMLPSSVYRRTVSDTNKESDWAIDVGTVVPGDGVSYRVSNQAWIGRANGDAQLDMNSWTGRSFSSTYLPGSARLHAWGATQTLGIEAYAGTTSTTITPQYSPALPASATHQHPLSGYADPANQQFVSTSLLHTATFNTPGSAISTGYPVSTSGWTGSTASLSDGNAATSISASSSTVRHPDKYFLDRPSAATMAGAVRLTSASGWCYAIPGSDFEVVDEMALPSPAQFGQVNDLPTYTGGPSAPIGDSNVYTIDDSTTGEGAMLRCPIEASFYKTNLHAFSMRMPLDFNLADRTTGITSYQSLKITIKAVALVHGRYYTMGGERDTLSTIPISVSLGNPNNVIGYTRGSTNFVDGAGVINSQTPMGDRLWENWIDDEVAFTYQTSTPVWGTEGDVYLAWGTNVDMVSDTGKNWRWRDGPLGWDGETPQGIIGDWMGAFDPTTQPTLFSFMETFLYIEEAYVEIINDETNLALIGADRALVTPAIQISSIPAAKQDDWNLVLGGKISDMFMFGYPHIDPLLQYDAIGPGYSTTLPPSTVTGFNAFMFENHASLIPKTATLFRVGQYVLEWSDFTTRRRVQYQVYESGAWGNWLTLPASPTLSTPGVWVANDGTFAAKIPTSSTATAVRIRIAYILPNGFATGDLVLKSHNYASGFSSPDRYQNNLAGDYIEFVQTRNILRATASCSFLDLEIKATGYDETGFDTVNALELDLLPLSALHGLPLTSWSQIAQISDLNIRFRLDELFQAVDYRSGTSLIADSLDAELGAADFRYSLEVSAWDDTAQSWLEVGTGAEILENQALRYEAHDGVTDPYREIDLTLSGDCRRFFHETGNPSNPFSMKIRVSVTFHWDSGAKSDIFNGNGVNAIQNMWVTKKSCIYVQQAMIYAKLITVAGTSFPVIEYPGYYAKDSWAWLDLGEWPNPGASPVGSWPTSGTIDNLAVNPRASAETRVTVDGGRLLGSQGIVLNEIIAQQTDVRVEIYNYGTDIVTSGYSIVLLDNSGPIGKVIPLTAVFGSQLPAGQTAAASLLPHLSHGYDLATLTVLLLSPEGVIIDAFVGPSSNNIGAPMSVGEWKGTTRRSYASGCAARVNDVDTNSEIDWIEAAGALSTLGSINNVWGTALQQTGLADLYFSNIVNTEIDVTTSWSGDVNLAFSGLSNAATAFSTGLVKLELLLSGATSTALPFKRSETISRAGLSEAQASFPQGAAQKFQATRRFLDTIDVKTRLADDAQYRAYLILVHVSKVAADGSISSFAGARSDLDAGVNSMLVPFDAFVRYTTGDHATYQMTRIDARGINMKLDIGTYYAVQFFPVDTSFNLVNDLALDIATTGVVQKAGECALSYASTTWTGLSSDLWIDLILSDRGAWYVPLKDLTFVNGIATWQVPAATMPVELNGLITKDNILSWRNGKTFKFLLHASLEDATWTNNDELDGVFLSTELSMHLDLDIVAREPASITSVTPFAARTFSATIPADTNAVIVDLDAIADLLYWRGYEAVAPEQNRWTMDTTWSSGTASRIAQIIKVPVSAESLDAVTIWVNGKAGGLSSSRIFLTWYRVDAMGKPTGTPIFPRYDVTRFFATSFPSAVSIQGLGLPMGNSPAGPLQGARIACALEFEDGQAWSFMASSANTYASGGLFQVQGVDWTGASASDLCFVVDFSKTISLRSSGYSALYNMLKSNGEGSTSLVQVFNRKTSTWNNLVVATRGELPGDESGDMWGVGNGLPPLSFFQSIPDISAIRSAAGIVDFRIITDFAYLASTVLADPTISGYSLFFSSSSIVVRAVSGVNSRPSSVQVIRSTTTPFSVIIPTLTDLASVDSISLESIGVDRVTVKTTVGEILAKDVDIARGNTAALFDGRLLITSTAAVASIQSAKFPYDMTFEPGQPGSPDYEYPASSQPVASFRHPLSGSIFTTTDPASVFSTGVYGNGLSSSTWLASLSRCLAIDIPSSPPVLGTDDGVKTLSFDLWIPGFVPDQQFISVGIYFDQPMPAMTMPYCTGEVNRLYYRNYISTTLDPSKAQRFSFEFTPGMIVAKLDGVLAWSQAMPATSKQLTAIQLFTGETYAVSSGTSSRSTFVTKRIDNVEASWIVSAVPSASIANRLDFHHDLREYLLPVANGGYMFTGQVESTLSISSTLNMPVVIEHSYIAASIAATVRSSAFDSMLVSSRIGIKNLEYAELTGDTNPDILLDDGFIAKAEESDRVYRIKIQAIANDQAIGSPVYRDMYVCASAPKPQILPGMSDETDRSILFSGSGSNPAIYKYMLPAAAPVSAPVAVELDVYFVLNGASPRKFLIKLLNAFGLPMFTLKLQQASSGPATTILVNEDEIGTVTASSAPMSTSTWTHVSMLVRGPHTVEVSVGMNSVQVTSASAVLTSPIRALQFEASDQVHVDNIATSWTGVVEQVAYQCPIDTSIAMESTAWSTLDASPTSTARITLTPADSNAIEIDGTAPAVLSAYDRNVHTSQVQFAISTDSGLNWIDIGYDTTSTDGIYSITANL